MAECRHLMSVFGYTFYQLTFTAILCILPYMFFKYVIYGVVLCVVSSGLTLLHERLTTEVIIGQGRGVFITGCDTGLGNLCARYLDDLGFTVFAGCLDEKSHGARKLKKESSKRLHVVEVNVTKEESVAKTFSYVKKNLPKKGLWGIVNNAGINLIAEVELSTISVYEKGMDVNFYGPIRVIKTFLPLIRKFKGRVVNVTSVHGLMAIPQWSIYGSTKVGLETLSDSLRMEMTKFGVNVSVVEPGMFGVFTAIHHEAMVNREKKDIEDMWNEASPDVQRTYSKQFIMSWVPPPTPPRNDGDPHGVSRAIEHALCSARPRGRYLVPGRGSKIPFIDEFATLAMVYRQLPTWIVDWYIITWRGCRTF